MRYSILLNLLLLTVLVLVVHRLGGWRFAWFRFTHDEAGLYHHRKQLFEQLPVQPGAIIFLGDSQVQGCEWQELCSGLFEAPVLNRGIAGDHVEGVAARLDEVLRHRPRALLLEVGINDLLFGKRPEEIATVYRQIVERIRRESAATTVVLHGVLPVNNAVKRVGVSNRRIAELNEVLRALAQAQGLPFVELQAALSDSEGNLSAAYTADGIHLNGAGYAVWRANLRGL